MNASEKTVTTYLLTIVGVCIAMIIYWHWLIPAIVLPLWLFFHPDQLMRIFQRGAK